MCHETCPKPVSGGAPLTESTAIVERDNDRIPVTLIEPEGATSGLPGVVLMHDVWGANAFYHDAARRLAAEGYLVALPDLFHRAAPLVEPDREAVMARAARAVQSDQLGDLVAVADWLAGHEHGNGSFATVGFCMGGTLTFLLAARTPAPAAGVAFYGFPAKPATDNAPVRPIDETEVAAVNTPLLGLWGDGDAGVGMENVRAYDEALTRHNRPHTFTVYPDAGHGFLTFDPAAATFGTSQRAWDAAVAFLREHLGRAS